MSVLLRIFREITGGLTPQILANSACLTSAIGVLLINRGWCGGRAGFRAEFRPDAAGWRPAGWFSRRGRTGRGWLATGGGDFRGGARPGATGWRPAAAIFAAEPDRARPAGDRRRRFSRHGRRVDYRSHTQTIRRAGGAG